MNFVEIINKKKYKIKLSKQEIENFVCDYVNQKIPDYQVAAFLMAIYFNGMSDQELYWLTSAIINSGKKLTFNKDAQKPLVDKHSTGGIGDKVSLILGPLLSCFDIRVAKLSGRGLGFTGGTIDKLDSINVRTDLNEYDVKCLLNKCSIFISQQQNDLVPADKLLYALRDVTGTVDSIPLIISSILSKKFVINSDYVFLDIKYGSGSFFKTLKKAKEASLRFVKIAKLFKRNLRCHISSMDQPLGRGIGNLIEIKEVLDFFKNEPVSEDLKELIFSFAADILVTTKKFRSKQIAVKECEKIVVSGVALKKFYFWIANQHGNIELLKSNDYFHPKYEAKIMSHMTGYVYWKDVSKLGNLSITLGAGREKKEDKIDFHAGIWLNAKTNEHVKKNQLVATLYSNKKITDDQINICKKAFIIKNKKSQLKPLIV